MSDLVASIQTEESSLQQIAVSDIVGIDVGDSVIQLDTDDTAVLINPTTSELATVNFPTTELTIVQGGSAVAIKYEAIIVTVSTVTTDIVGIGCIAGGGTAALVEYGTFAAYDSLDQNLFYICFAPEGSLTADAVWKILRKNKTTGEILYADGDQLYDNVCDDRESLSYS